MSKYKRDDVLVSPLDDAWEWLIMRFMNVSSAAQERYREERRQFRDTMVLPKKVLTRDGMELPLNKAGDALWFLEQDFQYEKTPEQLAREAIKFKKKAS